MSSASSAAGMHERRGREGRGRGRAENVRIVVSEERKPQVLKKMLDFWFPRCYISQALERKAHGFLPSKQNLKKLEKSS